MKQSSVLSLLLVFTLAVTAQKSTTVSIIGQMKDVMWKGQLEGKISLDTISDRTNLYGFGPLEFLSGEILILDGRSYVSTVDSYTAMKVEETYRLKSPFFAYSNIPRWTEQELPSEVLTISTFEKYLDSLTKSLPRPFLFKLTGIVDKATIHIVNLPPGTKVKSPDEAHKGQVNYNLYAEPVEIIGFFSTNHQSIFTHHDTFLHMHLITVTWKKMGHLDEALFQKGKMKLFLPAE